MCVKGGFAVVKWRAGWELGQLMILWLMRNDSSESWIVIRGSLCFTVCDFFCLCMLSAAFSSEVSVILNSPSVCGTKQTTCWQKSTYKKVYNHTMSIVFTCLFWDTESWVKNANRQHATYVVVRA